MRSTWLSLPLIAPAFGAVAANPPPPWSGEASAGVVVTTGNSESSTANGKGEVVYASRLWRNTSNVAALRSEQTDALTGAGVVTAERYAAGNKTDFNFTDRDYAFLALEFEKDLIGPVRERTSETVGCGRRILTGPAHLLEAELGAGARQTELRLSLVGTLFALASYTVRSNTDVPPGTKKTDTVTAFSLGWSFGK